MNCIYFKVNERILEKVSFAREAADIPNVQVSLQNELYSH